MAKEVIVLETNQNDGGFITIRAVFWIPVTSGQEQPIQSLAASAWSGASAAEIGALQQGTVLEEVRTFVFPSTMATADVQKLLQTGWNSRAAYLATVPPKGQYYGVYFDSVAGWKAKGT